MTKEEALSLLNEAKEQHREAKAAVKSTKENFYTAIRDAVIAGATKAEISRLIGVTDARVHQIVNPMLREIGVKVRQFQQG